MCDDARVRLDALVRTTDNVANWCGSRLRACEVLPPSALLPLLTIVTDNSARIAHELQDLRLDLGG